VAEYLSAYTDKLIGFAIGLPAVKQLVEEQFYTDLAGGVLEGAGRLFKHSVKAYVYPARDPKTGKIEPIDDVRMPTPWEHLRHLLRELGRVKAISPSDEELLSIQSRDVLARIANADVSWESMVSQRAVEIIKSKHLFGAAGIEASRSAVVRLTSSSNPRLRFYEQKTRLMTVRLRDRRNRHVEYPIDRPPAERDEPINRPRRIGSALLRPC
jgi:hypothetical protein